MNILHLSGALTWRGGEQQLMYLFEELYNGNNQQFILCPEKSELYKRLTTKGLNTVIPYKQRSSVNIILSYRLKQICIDKKIDIIHVHDAHAHTTAFISAIFWGNKTPIVVSRRVDFPIGKSFLSKLKYNHKSVKKIICVSEAIKQVMLPDIKNKGILSVVHSGIDLERFPYKSPTGILRKELELPEKYFIVGNTSALAPHKDYYTFIETAKLILKERQDVHFVIIGKGPLEGEIKKYVNKQNLTPHISFMGFRTNIHELLPDFDVFLMTSKTEGLGTSILDAFACGVPVVTTNAGGIGEMINDGKAGLIAEISNSLQLSENVLTLISNTNIKEQIVSEALLKLNSFTKQQTALKTMGVYLELKS